MTISVLIVNTNDAPPIFDCLDAVAHEGAVLEIIVVDNGSTDGSPERIETTHPGVRLKRMGYNSGFCVAVNAGAALARGDILLLLNPDARPLAGALSCMLDAFSDVDLPAEIVSPRVYRRDSTPLVFDSAGCEIEYPLGECPPRGYLAADAGQFEDRVEVAFAAGAALGIRRELFNVLGGLDEDFWAYGDDSDLCWRARLLGYRTVYDPRPVFEHIGSFNFGRKPVQKVYLQTRNRMRMCIQNYGRSALVTFILSEMVSASTIVLSCLAFPSYRAYGFAYVRGWLDAVRDLPAILRKRRERQHARVRGDVEVLRIHRRVSLAASMLRYARFVLGRKSTVFGPR